MNYERQLERWSLGPSKTEETGLEKIEDRVERIISKYEPRNPHIKNKSIKVYLQGSFANGTNIKEDSDIDIIVHLESAVSWSSSNFTSEEIEQINNLPPLEHTFDEFKSEIYDAIQYDYSGIADVILGDKSIKIEYRAQNSNRKADVIPCFSYSDTMKDDGSWLKKEGISFTTNRGEEIHSFPKLHINACENKDKNTNGLYKGTIRIFKNIKSILVEEGLMDEKIAPSYYIENLLYIPPNTHYKEIYADTIKELLHFFDNKEDDELKNYYCANDKKKLFDTNEWNIFDCRKFLENIREYINHVKKTAY